jgi:hypothetical protein
MALRAKKPESAEKRLKMFLFGPAGIGKTTAAIQFPNAYIIDCEKGTEHYGKLIEASGSQVFATTDIHDMIAEVRALATEKHDFRTLVIDPITTIYNDLLDKCEQKVGSDFGRHYGAANKEMKRLSNLIMALDMNVVVTAHAKAEYGPKLEKIGQTFDGWKSLDYIFDLVIELGRTQNFNDFASANTRRDKGRFARVRKTRLEAFPDLDVFEWSYDAVRQRYGGELLERAATAIQLATPEQVKEIRTLLDLVRLPEQTAERWLAKAGVEDWDDMPGDTVKKCIEFVKGKLEAQTA